MDAVWVDHEPGCPFEYQVLIDNVRFEPDGFKVDLHAAVLGVRHGHSAHQSQDCLLVHHRCQ